MIILFLRLFVGLTYRVGWTSKASANQRAGRAGRTEPGHCYRSVYLSQLGLVLFELEIIEPEAGVVDGESIHSGKVPVHPLQAHNPIRRESPFKLGSVSNGEREKDSWSQLRPLAWLLYADLLLLLCRGSSGSVVRASD